MKPYQHSRISAHVFGGIWSDYQPVHDWFDQTKASLAIMAHRAALHSSDFGKMLCLQVFGTHIVNTDQKRISVEDIALQHIEDDLGAFTPVADWLDHVPAPRWLDENERMVPPDLAGLDEHPEQFLADRFGGDPITFTPLVAWFDQTKRYYEGPKHRVLLHNAFGAFLAEQVFGTLVHPRPDRAVGVRDIAEMIIMVRTGHIPTLQDLFGRIPIQPWMHGATVVEKGRSRPVPELAD